MVALPDDEAVVGFAQVLGDDADQFYESFPHRTKCGYRIYPVRRHQR